MKKYSIAIMSALLLVAFSVPAMAKVNLSGGMWVTYYAQKQSHDLTISREANGADIQDPAQVASKKTFILGQDMTNNGVNAHAVRGNGLLLGLDCPVNDWVKAYAELNANDAGLNPVVREAYIDVAFMPALKMQAGLMEIPFGQERNDRPDVGVEEVFITEYTVDANGMLLVDNCEGIQVYGTVLGNMLDYSVYAINGCLQTAADTGWATGTDLGPDANDAKSVGGNLVLRPISGLYLGLGAIGGDYSALVNGQGYSAYDINAGYDFANVLKISGDYAVSTYDEMLLVNIRGTSLPTLLDARSGKVSEYIVKGIYDGIQDVELGIRYAVVDPKNVESEQAAGYNDEAKLSFAASYEFARNTVVKAEYSWVSSDRSYLKDYAAAAGNQNSGDPDDDIFALQLGVQF